MAFHFQCCVQCACTYTGLTQSIHTISRRKFHRIRPSNYIWIFDFFMRFFFACVIVSDSLCSCCFCFIISNSETVQFQLKFYYRIRVNLCSTLLISVPLCSFFYQLRIFESHLLLFGKIAFGVFFLLASLGRFFFLQQKVWSFTKRILIILPVHYCVLRKYWLSTEDRRRPSFSFALTLSVRCHRCLAPSLKPYHSNQIDHGFHRP